MAQTVTIKILFLSRSLPPCDLWLVYAVSFEFKDVWHISNLPEFDPMKFKELSEEDSQNFEVN